jgi:hypothetical protein
MLATLATERGPRMSAGAGTKGPRWYAWTWLPRAAPWPPDWCRWLLVRRSLRAPTALTAYGVFAPRATPWKRSCQWQAAGGRWNGAWKRQKARLGWSTMRGAVGRAGIGLSPWRCGRMRCGRCCALARSNGGRTQTNAPPACPEQPGSLQGGARPAVALSVGESRSLFWRPGLATQQCGARSGLVDVAPLASRYRPILALQTTRCFITTTVVLGMLEKAVGMPYTLCRHKHDGRMTVHIPSFSRSLLRLALCARRVQTGIHL